MEKLKALKEKRNDILVEATKILDTVEEETRAMTEEENSKYNSLVSEADALGKTIKAIEEKRALDCTEKGKTENEEEELRAFEAYCRGEERALTVGSNGSLVPNTIAKMIVEEMKEYSPLFAEATPFHEKGGISIPLFKDDITAAYMDELKAPTDTSNGLKTVDLKAYIVAAKTIISKKLINNMDFDIVPYIVRKVAESLAEFADKEGLTGETKIKGIFPHATNVVTAATSDVTAEDLVNLQCKISTMARKNAVWIMHPETFAAIRKLKTANGDFIFIPDTINSTDGKILAKPVWIDENAPKIGASAKCIAFGDPKAYAFNVASGIETEILKEKYAEEYGVGIVSHAEMDGAILNQSGWAVLQLAPGK